MRNHRVTRMFGWTFSCGACKTYEEGESSSIKKARQHARDHVKYYCQSKFP